MNVYTLVKGDISARFFALATIVSLVLSAFPVAFFVAEAATALHGPANATITEVGGEYTSGVFNASAYENLTFSFGYDATELDATNDSFTYGWRDAGGDNDIATIVGLANAVAAEIDTVSVALPPAAQVSDLEVYIYVTADPGAETDEVVLTNISVSGDLIVAGTVRNVDDDLYFATIQEAIDAATTADGETIELTANVTTSAQVTINKEIIFDGSGFTIDAAFSETDNDNNAAVGIIGTDNVTVRDIVLDGTNGTNLHGLNVYESTGITVENVTSKNFRSGMVANGSTVDASDFSTQGNTWHGINVAPGSGVTSPSILNISNTSAHAEVAPTPHIFTDDVTAGVIEVNDLDSQYDVISVGDARAYFLKAVPVEKDETTIVISGNTSAGENLPGWMFNRDPGNVTPFAFNDTEASLNNGSIEVFPIGNNPSDKFIGEYFTGGNLLASDFESFSYHYQIAGNGTQADSSDFYLNVYTNLTNPTGFYDCRYDFVPTNGVVGSFVEFTADASADADAVAIRNSASCPASISELPAGSSIRAFAINLGQSNGSDIGLGGYFDEVVLNTATKITTFDFEKGAVDPNDENQLTITAIKFHNRNADNNRDAGEEGLAGWEMRLYKDMDTSWSLIATGTTDVSGNKKFPQQFQAGTYYVCEVAQLGWTQVAPAEDTQTVNVSPNALEEGPYCTKTVYSDESDRSTKPEIGNVSNDPNNENQLNISGETYLDIAIDDCNNRTECLFSRTDTKLAGWEMRLYKEVAGIWTEVATSTTDNDGIYRFPTQYSAGVYHTCEVLEAGYEQGIGNWNGSGYLVNTLNLSGSADEGPYCNTYTYTDTSDRSSKSHFGNAVAFVPAPQCTVDIKSSSSTIVVESNDYAVETYDGNNRWTASIPGATWIWNTLFVEDTEVSTTKTFKETFTATNISDATLNIAADNTYKLYINGQLVVDNTQENNYSSFSQDSYSYAELGGYLQDGENTIEIEVTNLPLENSSKFSNPAGALFNLVVTAEEGCAVTTKPEVIVDEAPDTYLITGTKYASIDGAESAPYAGYEITLSQGEFSQSTTTDANGEYYFEVEAGDWEVSEALGENWTQDSVLQNGNEVTTESAVEACDFTVTDSVETTYNCDFYNSYTEPAQETPVVDPPAQRRSSNSGGTRVLRTASPAPLVLGASTSICPFLTEFMQVGADNNQMEVMKLQLFLNIFKNVYGGVENPVTGTFGVITDANVKAFQEHYRTEVLDPWFEKGIVPHDRPTGFVYKTTLWKINSLVCPDAVYPSFEGEDLTSNVDNDIEDVVID